MKWVSAVCKPSKWTHAISINCACVLFLSQKSVFPGIFALIPFLALNISFTESLWVVTNLEILLPLSVLSSSASISLALFLNSLIPQPTCLSFVRSFFFFKCSTLWKQSYDQWGKCLWASHVCVQRWASVHLTGWLTKNEGIYFKGQCCFLHR